MSIQMKEKQYACIAYTYFHSITYRLSCIIKMNRNQNVFYYYYYYYTRIFQQHEIPDALQKIASLSISRRVIALMRLYLNCR